MTTTTRLANRSTVGILCALVVAACGGNPPAPGATGATGGTGATGAGGPGGVASTGQPGPATQGPSGPAATISGGTATRAPGANVSPAPGVTDEACSMLDAAAIESLTGATLVTKVPAQQLGIFPNGCLFELTRDGTTTSINLGVMTSGGRAYYDTEIAPTNIQNGYTPIEGLGDVAVNARAGSVMAVAGDVLLSVQYFGPAGPDRAIALEVARRVLANLGL